MLHGSMTTVDEVLNRFDDAIIEANPTAENWGTSKSAQDAAEAAMAMWAAPSPPTGEGTLWLPPGAKEPTIPDQ